MRDRPVMDLAALPLHGKLSASVTWWGTLSFMLIEGTGFALSIAVYLYLMSLATVWPIDAPRPDLALKFMNFMLEGKNSSELTNLIGSGNPNLDAVKYIKPEILKNPAIFPDKAVEAKLEQLKELTSAQRRLRNLLWTEIKAGR